MLDGEVAAGGVDRAVFASTRCEAGELDLFVDGGDGDHGVLEGWFSVGDAQEEGGPEVRVERGGEEGSSVVAEEGEVVVF